MKVKSRLDFDKKETWGPGPWQSEPDRVDGEFLGFATLALRGPMGAWCGYVGVDASHPWFGKRYDVCLKKNCKKWTTAQMRNHYRSLRERAKNAHERKSWDNLAQLYRKGGFYDRRDKQLHSNCRHYHSRVEGLLSVHGGITYSDACHEPICHPHDSAEGGVWWFGFDTAHAWDLAPKMAALTRALDAEAGRAASSYHDDDVYRDLPFVQNEIQNLARQLSLARQVWGKVPIDGIPALMEAANESPTDQA